jgi:type I restriction enzyme, R subunit
MMSDKCTIQNKKIRWPKNADMNEYVIASLEMGRDDFEFTPFKENGGIGKVYQLFGEELCGISLST